MLKFIKKQIAQNQVLDFPNKFSILEFENPQEYMYDCQKLFEPFQFTMWNWIFLFCIGWIKAKNSEKERWSIM